MDDLLIALLAYDADTSTYNPDNAELTDELLTELIRRDLAEAGLI